MKILSWLFKAMPAIAIITLLIYTAAIWDANDVRNRETIMKCKATEMFTYSGHSGIRRVYDCTTTDQKDVPQSPASKPVEPS